MRIFFLWLVVLMAGRADGQILGGIFNQGATELKEYGQQIAALAVMIGKLEKGYQIIEGGEDSIGTSAAGEYGLHHTYFASLAAVDPAIGRMQEVREILSLEMAMVEGFGAAVKRWGASGKLTAAEMGIVGEVYAGVVTAAGQIVGELKEVLADGEWVMGDWERVAVIIRLWRSMAEKE